MSPELRRTDWEGTIWNSPRLGIDREQAYSLNSHFFKDTDFKRVQETWMKSDGTPDKINNRTGWWVGHITTGHTQSGKLCEWELVVLDGDSFATGINILHLKELNLKRIDSSKPLRIQLEETVLYQY